MYRRLCDLRIDLEQMNETIKALVEDHWLWAIIERSGKCKAAVALANKNVRTAWAMLTQNTEYQRYPLAA